ncbi:hypothetical protein BDD12DRAFT_204278 [Trichophaea hybrida]|nr:hypothetical protein BDD12DRAFT_204278 [Trichophaea hybrida]
MGRSQSVYRSCNLVSQKLLVCSSRLAWKNSEGHLCIYGVRMEVGRGFERELPGLPGSWRALGTIFSLGDKSTSLFTLYLGLVIFPPSIHLFITLFLKATWRVRIGTWWREGICFWGASGRARRKPRGGGDNDFRFPGSVRIAINGGLLYLEKQTSSRSAGGGE